VARRPSTGRRSCLRRDKPPKHEWQRVSAATVCHCNDTSSAGQRMPSAVDAWRCFRLALAGCESSATSVNPLLSCRPFLPAALVEQARYEEPDGRWRFDCRRHWRGKVLRRSYRTVVGLSVMVSLAPLCRLLVGRGGRAGRARSRECESVHCYATFCGQDVSIAAAAELSIHRATVHRWIEVGRRDTSADLFRAPVQAQSHSADRARSLQAPHPPWGLRALTSASQRGVPEPQRPAAW